MELQTIQILSQFPFPIPQNSYLKFTITYTSFKTHRKTYFSGVGFRRKKNNANRNRRSRFTEAYTTDGYDENDEFRFRKTGKQRIWWSDDDDDDDDDEDEGFGILEGSIGFNWALKVFRAFGWMIPAIIISLLVGNGPNTIVMALALPLAQSAFSLAVDTFCGWSDDVPRPKSKRKKRPFSGARGRARVRNERVKETRTQTGKEASNYQTWVDGYSDSTGNMKGKASNFGGWDDLDNRVRVDIGSFVEKEDEAGPEERVKISRRTKGESPLVVRLLIAMFPFLGFWIKLF